MKFFQCDLGQFALETPRDTRQVRGAKLWFSFAPQTPPEIKVGKKEPGSGEGKGRNNKLNSTPGSLLTKEHACWHILVREDSPNKEDEIGKILDSIIGATATSDRPAIEGGIQFPESSAPIVSSADQQDISRKVVTPEEDEDRRKKQAENGALGEEIAKRYEIHRLTDLRCPDASRVVDHVAQKNVNAGYDLYSDWNGEVRYIEVKSGESNPEIFFISPNEINTLTKHGDSAWIYIVDLTKKDDLYSCIREIRNPGAKFHGDIALKVTQYSASIRKLDK